MGMHRDWVTKKRVRDQDVLTLVTYEGVPDESHALYCLPKAYRPLDEGTTANYDIRIKGENFVPSSEPPRLVLLSKPHHASTVATEVFQKLAGASVFDLYRSGDPSSAKRGLFVDGRVLLRQKTFQAFCDRSVTHHSKASTRCVLHQDDDASRELAELLATALATNFKLPRPSVVAACDVSSRTVAKVEGLIAVACVVGRGSELLALNRALRGIHDGPRLFLIGIQVTESQLQLETFDKNLCHSATKASIEVVRFGQAAVGPTLLKSFEDEQTTLRLAEISSRIPPELKARSHLLSNSSAPRLQHSLLPTGPQPTDVLMLRKDFAFWSSSYADGPHQAEVVGTLAVLLQRARENKDIAAGQKLFSPVLGQVALDPENFARYDDGLIQAAILRASLPSELDYRGNTRASEFMRDFLLRMSKYLDSERSEGVLEFLLSLATAKMKLDSDHLEQVRRAFLNAARSKRAAVSKSIIYLCSRSSSEPGERDEHVFRSR